MAATMLHHVTVGWQVDEDGCLMGYAMSCTCGFYRAPVGTLGAAEGAARRHLAQVRGRAQPRASAVRP